MVVALTHDDRGRLTRPLTFLNAAFWVWVAAYAFLVAAGLASDANMPWLLILAALAMIGAGPVFLISLAVLARRLGASWIVWLGLAIVVPFGVLFAYFGIRSRAAAALS